MHLEKGQALGPKTNQGEKTQAYFQCVEKSGTTPKTGLETLWSYQVTFHK